MIEWQDESLLLSTRRYGETAVIASVFTRHHGRWQGLVAGGTGQKLRPLLQTGNTLRVVWKARLAEQLGNANCELLIPYAARVLHDRDRLACLNALCALIAAVLPEREPHEALFESTMAMLASLTGPAWASVYVHWELGLLQAIGYGLDLSRCAATGSTDDLIYVSPKSACAVSGAAGLPYRDRLLPLPSFLLTGEPGERADVLAALHLTGYFLERFIRNHHNAGLPSARRRFEERMTA